MRILIASLLTLFVVDAPAQERVRRKDNPASKAVSQAGLDAISARVKGVCVDGTTGEPLAGVLVDVHAWGGRSKGVPSELKTPTKVTTGADGVFEIRVLAREEFQVSFAAELAGRWPRTGRWNHLNPGQVEDLGEVPLHPGVQAVGKVVDENGKAVAGVTVGIDDLNLFLGSENGNGRPKAFAAGERPLAAHWAANGVRWARSKEDGVFTTKVALPAGTFPMRINQRHLSLIEPKTITIPDQGPMKPIKLVVREQPFMAGKVVDETGKPVKGVNFHARFAGRGGGRLASGRSGADGSFKIYRVDGAPDSAKLFVMNPGPCERKTLSEVYKWGQTDILIELQRALSIDFVVTEAGTGKPIEDFAIRAFPIGGGGMNSMDRRTRMSGHHEDGKLTIDRIRRGTNRVVVVPEDPQLPVTPIDIDAKKGAGVIEIAVTRLVPMIVQVLDEEGVPKKNATVLVIEPGNYQHAGASFGPYDPRSDSPGPMSSDPETTFDMEIFRATTDAGGQCIVYGISGRTDLALGVRTGNSKLHREDKVAFGPKGNGHTINLKKK